MLKDAVRISDLSGLEGFNEICLTGGEPTLNIVRLTKIVVELAERYPTTKLYLYTAKYSPTIAGLMGYLSGVHYTVHSEEAHGENASDDFREMQGLAWQHANKPGLAARTFRCTVHKDFHGELSVIPYVWYRFEIKDWTPASECKLPANEALFILSEEYLK